MGCHREADFVTEGTRATTRHETALRTEETAYERTGNRSFMTQVRMARRSGARLTLVFVFPYAVASLTHTRCRSLAPPTAGLVNRCRALCLGVSDRLEEDGFISLEKGKVLFGEKERLMMSNDE